MDSTRSGKRFPDSLTSTLPIWCCVLNRLVADEAFFAQEDVNVWDTEFHAPRYRYMTNLALRYYSSTSRQAVGYASGVCSDPLVIITS